MKTRNELCKALNISQASLNNWYRTGVIKTPSNGLRYTEKEFSQIKKIIFTESGKLMGRANRLHIKNSSICYSGITDPGTKRLLLHAIQIHQKSNLHTEKSVVFLSMHILKSAGYLNDTFQDSPQSKLDLFFMNWCNEAGVAEFNNNIYSELGHFNCDDDFIGAFYQSIQSVSQKSRFGSYFTPGILLKDISIASDMKVLDPCCGSGGLLLHVLGKNHDPSMVYARDIDEIALGICAVNLSLFFKSNEMKFNVGFSDILGIKSISQSSFFRSTENQIRFDCIITNPPWGSKLDFIQKKVLIKKYTEISTSESFSVALYNSLNMLSSIGYLIFFLPHSFLNVGTHKNIRKYVVSKKKQVKISILGNAFKGVVSEAARLIYYNGKVSDHIEVTNNGMRHILKYNEIDSQAAVINATTDCAEKKIIAHIFKKQHFTLKDNAEFALGIVTGNNAKHIVSNKTSVHMEPIYRGRDILPFRFSDPQCYIEFHPEKYQQTACVDKYRQTKIAYRFISDRIICALDNDGSLLLNSANLFIPRIIYPTETIICLFNSGLYSFIYKKMYHSKKVLRSHIESFPLPVVANHVHTQFKKIYQKCIRDENCSDELNNTVYSVFKLTNKQIEIIKQDCACYNIYNN